MKRFAKIVLATVLFCMIVIAAGKFQQAKADTYDGYYPPITLDCGKYQQSSKGCGVASQAMIEGGFFDTNFSSWVKYDSRTDVFKRWEAYNGDTTNYWFKDAYNENSVSSQAAYLKALYNQLAKGYPVIVHRNGSEGGNHFSVVYAYTGSTTTLELAGFKVANTASYFSYCKVQTLKEWTSKDGISGWHYLYRTGGMTANTIVNNIVFAVNHPATYHKKGSSQTVWGKVVDNVNITKVRVGIYKSDGTTKVYEYNATPNAKYYNVNNADSAMKKFKTLADGTYYYKIYAEDAGGRTGTYSFKFYVVSSKPTSGSANKPDVTLKVVLNANGGTVSPDFVNVKWSSQQRTCKYGTLPTPTRSGYTFAGWYSAASGGKKVTADTVVNNASWQTLYAHWTKATYTVTKYSGSYKSWNHTQQAAGFEGCEFDYLSMKNYLREINRATVGNSYYSRDSSIAIVEYDSSVTHNDNASLKIVSTAGGKSGKDIIFKTLTQGRVEDGYIGDNRSMIMSFWAKSSNSGTKFYVRWGWEESYKNISLTTEWKKYTIRMDKTTAYNNLMSTYLDSAATVWISELQLEDGTTATDYKPAYFYTETEEYDNGYYNLSIPDGTSNLVKTGYVFDGWYTQMVGGTKITTSTAVKSGNICVYAHWRKVVDCPVVTSLTQTTDGVTLTWNEANGADKYQLRSNSTGGSNTSLGLIVDEPAETSSFDSADRLLMGVSYPYQLRAYNSGTGVYAFSNGGFEFNPFSDVSYKDGFYKALCWAFNNRIVSGTSKTTFSPSETVTRGQFATMIYRMAGKPSVEGLSMPFKDVKSTDGYYDAIVWAYNQGIIKGYSDKTFRPKNECTRGNVATMLYKFAGQPDVPDDTENPFTDVKSTEGYYKPIMWMVSNGITNGTSDTTFSPKASCKRSQVVTFLYRYDQLEE